MAARRAMRRPRTPSSMSWPMRNLSMPPPPPRNPNPRLTLNRRALGETGVCVRRRNHAHRTTGRHPGTGTHPRGPPPRRDLATRTAIRPVTDVVRVRALPGSDVPLPWLRQTRPGLRHRPHRGLPGRADTPVKPEVPMPFSSLTQNVLERPRAAGWTDNYPTEPSSGPAQPATPISPTPAACTCSRACVNPQPPCGPANHPPPNPPATAAP